MTRKQKIRKLLLPRLKPRKGSLLWYIRLPDDSKYVNITRVSGNNTMSDFDAYNAIMNRP